MQLTQKEMMYLKDAKSQEELCVAKYSNYSQQVSCPQLSNLLQQIAGHEQRHLQTVQQIMQGQMPSMGGAGGGMQQSMSAGMQPGGQMSQGAPGRGASMQAGSAGQQMQSGQTSGGAGGQQLSDQQICEDLLTTEKAVAGLYNHATFEFTNPQLRQVLSHIQKEEQEHAFQLFQYMQQKGWYQPQ